MSGTDDRVAVAASDAWPEDVEEEEGVVVNWFTREGRHVEEGEAICEIQVEKVSVDVPAPADGELVAVERDEDDEISSGDVLAYVAPG
ncbi:lipoyl domain-containing protein [Natronococcus occultus]|uniref:Pyruvate/2-oxoglutarate dehydrogenase complex, dihydrolipoamide acyltransferase component n=1 Tax=Natronococcus occultus SP4 TaxID=694430 RepID=L0JY07_9EURY|nr:biotin/lipoyl-containing protein [Natronococcus occultus]AGB36738.1 pyruvate/2-oxoglutarate dehydrogenase complex, dihydrolipoamide acyltransferase component [Natronococcus occultus SP4]